jgi:hypothetical protein
LFACLDMLVAEARRNHGCSLLDAKLR